MCLALYIATDQTLHEIPWNDNSPSLFIKSVKNRDHFNVEIQFTLGHIYYIGSHEGCGCGFIYDENDPDYLEDTEDLRLRIESVSKLALLIKSILSKSAFVEIFASYEGSQSEEPNKIGEIEPDSLLKTSLFADAWNNPQFVIVKYDRKYFYI